MRNPLVPVFENPRTKTVHHFKRLPDGRRDNIGITACGREEFAKNVAWTTPDAVTCRTCTKSQPHIYRFGRSDAANAEAFHDNSCPVCGGVDPACRLNDGNPI